VAFAGWQFTREGSGVSTFENDRYRWRETYFLLFDAAKRPSMEQVQKVLKKVNRQFEVHNPRTDDEGSFESVTVLAPAAYAALDISYVDGEEVQEQTVELSREFRDLASSPDERTKLDRLTACDARFDILHFEEVSDDGEEETFDPSALLMVVEALARITGGVAVDPQSGTIM
jgi:hypothetical protein